ncbi:hypothetical protein ACFQI7_30710 [Paenibacillus allorhizosphaerae]|uniref:Uncharacterized protein n=1 Tax=Paenibacillus allorhizosphaerae TaxID=2849866 RepID=A0ABM8VPS1_9BACL|nr:hypothetical protein [Paenibacillus allorhizosphaerae]CAG7653254.1 hypothetical protein PAECIP111802_05441 [Paenibacillus allorhizosphaerae]
MEGLLLLLVVVAVVYWMYRRNANWRTVLARSGEDARELEAKYAYLQSNQVKCRLKSDSDASLGAVQPAAAADWNRVERKKLQVHSKDLERAEELLQLYEEEQPSSII